MLVCDCGMQVSGEASHGGVEAAPESPPALPPSCTTSYTLQDFMLNKNYSQAPSLTFPPPTDALSPLPFTNSFALRDNNNKPQNTFLGRKGGLLRNILTSSGDGLVNVKRQVVSPSKTEANGSSSSDSGYGSKGKSPCAEDGDQSSEESRIPTLKRKAPPSSASQDSGKSKGESSQRKRRFERTKDALEQSGLLEITMKTAELIKSNRTLDSDISELKKSSQEFLRSVLNNPQNRQLREFLLAKKRERESTGLGGGNTAP